MPMVKPPAAGEGAPNGAAGCGVPNDGCCGVPNDGVDGAPNVGVPWLPPPPPKLNDALAGVEGAAKALVDVPSKR